MKPSELHFLRCTREVMGQSRLWMESQYVQHGVTSTLLHSLAVAYFALCIARLLRLAVSERSLIRGALLHDYYLYDWHDASAHAPLHGLSHPRVAWENAMRDLPEPLNAVEQDVILKHMFPLTPVPPACRESALVCLADKLCAVYETFARKQPYPHLQRMTALLAQPQEIR